MDPNHPDWSRAPQNPPPVAPGGVGIPQAAPVQAPQRSGGGGGAIVWILAGLGCFGAIAVVVVLGVVAYFLSARQSEVAEADIYGPTDVPVEGVGGPYVPLPADPLGPAAPGEPERFRVPVTPAQPSRGPADAPITIVEFSDFQCPFCARANTTLEQVVAAYPGQVRIVFRNNPLPFHTDAMPAAQAGLEARLQRGDDGFWLMHDQFFRNPRALARADLERYAGEVGLDIARFRTALDSRAHTAAIEADQELARQLGARGTPNFFINGRQLTGAQPINSFSEIIDDELARARRLEASGVPRAAIYDTLIRDGRTTAAPREEARPAARGGDDDPDRLHRVPVGDSPQRGPDDALVTLVVFSDFQCPFCSRLVPTLDRLKEQYGNDLRIVFKHNPLPFHTDAMPAAQLTVEARRQGGDPAFWRAHDLLFENSRSLSAADLARYARRLGLDAAAARRAVAAETHAATVRADMALASEIGARGTPTSFINGKKLAGAQPFERFRELIDREREAAQALERAGTPRGRIYDTLMLDAH